jgi:hypothetical protein
LPRPRRTSSPAERFGWTGAKPPPEPACALLIKRAPHRIRALAHDVRIDLRRLHVTVTEQLLYRADVVAVLEQMGREAVTERVAGRRLLDARRPNCSTDRALHGLLVQVVAPHDIRARIAARVLRRQDVLPAPLQVGAGIFARVRSHTDGQDRHAVPGTLAVAHEQLLVFETDVLDAESQGFHQAQAAAVQEIRDQPLGAPKMG